MSRPFFTYILQCRGGGLYTGHTDDLERRLAEHQSGAGSRYTSKHLPVALVWHQEFATREEARRAEATIKKWKRHKKDALVAGDWDAVIELARASWQEGSVVLPPPEPGMRAYPNARSGKRWQGGVES